MKYRKFLFLVAMLLILLPLSVTAQDSVPLDSARVSLSSKLNTLDPAESVVQPDIISQYFVYGRLFKLNLDFTTEPELAESMEMSDDALTATITLKEGLTYSDGSPILASDVAYVYQRQVDNESNWVFLLEPIESIDTPDDRTVIINLTEPYLNLPFVLSHMSMSIYPPAQVENDPEFESPISSGQYMVSEWTPGANEWTLVENPNYVFGPMAITELQFVAIPDLTSRVLQLSTGVVDYVYDVPAVAQDSFPPEVETYPVPIIGQYHVVFNVFTDALADDHPLKNVDVRHVISLAINRDEINEIAFFGTSTPATGFLYPRVEAGLDVLPNGGKQDLDAARELLAQTPYADGFDVSLQTWGARPGWTDAALIIADNLAEIGINVTVDPIEDAVAVANLRAHEYEMQFSGNTQDPLTFLTNQFTPGTFWGDASGYNNQEVTDLLSAARAATTPEEAIDLMHQAQQIAYDDMPLTPISERVVIVGNRVGRDILYEDNRQPGVNPTVATLADLQGN